MPTPDPNQSYPVRTLQAIAAALAAGGLAGYLITSLIVGSITATNLTVGNLNATSTARLQTVSVTSTAHLLGPTTIATTTVNGDALFNGIVTDAQSLQVNGISLLQGNVEATGHFCIYNGANFTKISFPSNSITPSYATSSGC